MSADVINPNIATEWFTNILFAELNATAMGKPKPRLPSKTLRNDCIGVHKAKEVEFGAVRKAADKARPPTLRPA